MKGFIKITVEPTEDGSISRTEVELKDVSFADKTCMLNAFLKSLQIPPLGSCTPPSCYPQRIC